MGKNREYLINREQYKKIKKYDHAQMDRWIREFVKNIKTDMREEYKEDIDKNEEVVNEMSKIYTLAIQEALENTKGIGSKIMESFKENYNKALDERLKNNDMLKSEKSE
ncbi:MAG: hypothetical protein HXL16_02425 [Peptostreptococcaceae bacterium]|nr:hypothetical protein [Peptostreptococcaceae bacterium]